MKREPCEEGRRVHSEKKISEIILAAMIDMWTVCWRTPEDKHNNRAVITLYQLKTNANARLNNMAASDTLLRGHNVCWNEHFGFSTQVAFLEVRKCYLRLLFLLNNTNVLFLST